MAAAAAAAAFGPRPSNCTTWSCSAEGGGRQRARACSAPRARRACPAILSASICHACIASAVSANAPSWSTDEHRSGIAPSSANCTTRATTWMPPASSVALGAPSRAPSRRRRMSCGSVLWSARARTAATQSEAPADMHGEPTEAMVGS